MHVQSWVANCVVIALVVGSQTRLFVIGYLHQEGIWAAASAS